MKFNIKTFQDSPDADSSLGGESDRILPGLPVILCKIKRIPYHRKSLTRDLSFANFICFLYRRHPGASPRISGAFCRRRATALITTSLKPWHAAVKIKRGIDVLPKWFASWRLSVNVRKSQAVSVGPHRKLPPPL